MTREHGSRSVQGIDLLAIGVFPETVIEQLAVAVSRRTRVPCRIRRETIKEPIPRLAERDQANADALLSRLDGLAAEQGIALVGVTLLDLGTPLFAHMFGQARLGGRAALVSLTRLTPAYYGLAADADLTVRRAVLEVFHELGHLGGLKHCREFNCLMHRATTVEDIDNRGDGFCAACRRALPPGLLAADGA